MESIKPKSKFASRVPAQWEFEGRKQTVAQWAKELGISEGGLRARVRIGGYTIAEALNYTKLDETMRARMGNHRKVKIERELKDENESTPQGQILKFDPVVISVHNTMDSNYVPILSGRPLEQYP